MGELFTNLGINGKLLFAQAANFLLVLFILQKFVFKRVLAFLEARQKTIEEGITMRALAEGEMARSKELTHQELKKAKEEGDALISFARARASAKEKELLGEVRSRAEAMLIKATQEATREKEDAIKSAEEEIKRRALMFAEKTLGRGLTKEDENRLVQEMKAYIENAHV